MRDRKIRIQDVAELAGVSVGSASRVLNSVANVSADVRQKVERAIAQLQYEPSHTARALRSRSSLTVGCMFSDITNPLYARSFRALEQRLRADGYMLLLAHGLNDTQRELDSLRTFQARGMDGVICAPGHERDPELIAQMNSMSIPIVLYDREMPGTHADALLFDHVNGMKRACARLFELGHDRIALALWHADSRPVRERIEGFQAAYREIGREVPDLIIRQATPTSSVHDDMLALLDGPSPPTALIAQGTHILVSALRAVANTGRRVPLDFSVIGIGDTDFAQMHDPAITVLRTDADAVAEQVRNLLLQRLTRDDPLDIAPQTVTAPYAFVERQSCGPCLENTVR